MTDYKLKTRRYMLEISANDIAKVLGISDDTVRKIEAGDPLVVSLENFQELYNAYLEKCESGKITPPTWKRIPEDYFNFFPAATKQQIDSLQKLRIARGYSADELSRNLGWSGAHINNYERHAAKMPVARLRKAVEFLQTHNKNNEFCFDELLENFSDLLADGDHTPAATDAQNSTPATDNKDSSNLDAVMNSSTHAAKNKDSSDFNAVLSEFLNDAGNSTTKQHESTPALDAPMNSSTHAQNDKDTFDFDAPLSEILDSTKQNTHRELDRALHAQFLHRDKAELKTETKTLSPEEEAAIALPTAPNSENPSWVDIFKNYTDDMCLALRWAAKIADKLRAKCPTRKERKVFFDALDVFIDSFEVNKNAQD